MENVRIPGEVCPWTKWGVKIKLNKSTLNKLLNEDPGIGYICIYKYIYLTFSGVY